MLADADGLQRTFRRDGDNPKVEVHDPLAPHRELLKVYHRFRYPQRDRLSGDLEMSDMKKLVLTTSLCLWPAVLAAQGLNPADILKPLDERLADLLRRLLGQALQQAHPDQSIQRQKPDPGLDQPHDRPAAGGGGGGPWRRSGIPTIIGGEGTDDAAAAAAAPTSAPPFWRWTASCTSPRPTTRGPWTPATGTSIWHYFWKTKGGTHIGNRGLGMWGNWLYMETPDDYLVSLDARTGKERWHKPIADFSQQYFSTMAPIVVGNHVLVGTGDDLDAPGFLQSFDPETGERQWNCYTVPHEGGRSRPRHLEEPRRRAATAAARSGFPAPTIPRPTFI